MESHQHERKEFDPPEAKLVFDAQGLIKKAAIQSERVGKPVDPIGFAQRTDDDIEALRSAINKEQGVVNPVVASAELSPEQMWLGELQTRFNALPQLHEGIQWTDVEKSLKADPEAMRKLQALDEKGHAMNVFGKENGKFVFVSAWNNYSQVSSDHRDINYDQAEKIATSMGVELTDTKYHEQFIREVSMVGWNWLKTDAATRKSGYAFCGRYSGVGRDDADDHNDPGSLRVALRVKEA